jgi:hypothetical protein
MSDLSAESIREALEFAAINTAEVATLAAAARAYLELLEGSQTIWWCERAMVPGPTTRRAG